MIVERTENPMWLSNAYLVADPERGTGVLIDGNDDLGPLLERARRDGIEITHVLVTHPHADHVAGLAEAIEQLGNPPVVAHEACAAEIDLAGRRATIGKRSLDLTAREFALLEVLASRHNRVTPREHVIEALCTWNDALTDNGLDIAVHRLRRKLEDTGVRLRTVRGLGYLLEADDDP